MTFHIVRESNVTFAGIGSVIFIVTFHIVTFHIAGESNVTFAGIVSVIFIDWKHTQELTQLAYFNATHLN